MVLCPFCMDDCVSHARRSACQRTTCTADATMTGVGDHAGRQHSRSDANRAFRQLSWLTIGIDGRETIRSAKTPDWKVGGWVGGLCFKLKEIGGESKSKLKMFKKKREIIKTPSISKRSRAGSPSSFSSVSCTCMISVSSCHSTEFPTFYSVVWGRFAAFRQIKIRLKRPSELSIGVGPRVCNIFILSWWTTEFGHLKCLCVYYRPSI